MKYKNKKWLYTEYVSKGKNMTEIGKSLGVHPSTIKYWIKKHSIPPKNMSEIIHNKCSNTFVNEGYINHVITGELLGDGYIQTGNGTSSRYIHNTSKIEYVKWLKNIFQRNNIMCDIRYIKNKGFGVHTYRLSTKSYPQFMEYRNVWYNNIKRIPKNLEINRTVLLHWYLGDGSLCSINSSSRTYYYIRLYTNGFVIEDIERLIKKLYDQLSINFYIKPMFYKKSGKTLYYIQTKMVYKFMEIIGDCPKPISKIYGHKFI